MTASVGTSALQITQPHIKLLPDVVSVAWDSVQVGDIIYNPLSARMTSIGIVTNITLTDYTVMSPHGRIYQQIPRWHGIKKRRVERHYNLPAFVRSFLRTVGRRNRAFVYKAKYAPYIDTISCNAYYHDGTDRITQEQDIVEAHDSYKHASRAYAFIVKCERKKAPRVQVWLKGLLA
ncbi:MAG: hypothetical protein AAF126_00370 [Chloroflexota bacterium]